MFRCVRCVRASGTGCAAAFYNSFCFHYLFFPWRDEESLIEIEAHRVGVQSADGRRASDGICDEYIYIYMSNWPMRSPDYDGMWFPRGRCRNTIGTDDVRRRGVHLIESANFHFHRFTLARRHIVIRVNRYWLHAQPNSTSSGSTALYYYRQW